MKKSIFCIFVLVLAQECFSQVGAPTSASATIVSIKQILQDAKVDSLLSNKDSIEAFNKIMRERAQNFKPVKKEIREGSSMDDVREILGKPKDVIPTDYFPGKEIWVYGKTRIYFLNKKVFHIISPT